MSIAMPTAMDTVVPPNLIELGERLRIGDLVDSLTQGDTRTALSLVDARGLDRGSLGALNARRETAFSFVRQDRLHVLLTAWLPGQFSPPHTHAGSQCDFRVLKGVATERRFTPTPGGGVTLIEEDRYLPGSIVSWNGEDIHALGNDADHAEVLLTLHVYRPAPNRQEYAFVDGGAG